MSVINYISEKIILPFSDIITGKLVHQKLNFLLESKHWPKEKIIEFQNERLRLLVAHASRYIPYYQNLFQELGLRPEDIKTKDDLVKLPILTKSTIKKEGIERFTSLDIPKRNRLKSSSSGSTGEPLFYYTTNEAYSLNIASSLRGWYDMGYRLGDKYIKLSQNQRNSPLKNIQDTFSNNLYLATNPLLDDNYRYILKEIERFRPKIIRCYPDPLLYIAQYRKKHPEFRYQPQSITTTGNTLFPEVRKEIESSFGCKIFDAYSCEGNSTVFECKTHTCYHATEEYGISEIIDENGLAINDGIGRLVSTDLWNFAHPFIRYDTQDLVEVDSRPCICGRSHLKIKRIIGRDNDILESKSGRKFIVHNFTGFFHKDISEIKRSIDQFQIIKRGEKIFFKLIVNDNFDTSVEEYIKEFWEKELNYNIDIEIVEEIPLSKGGKRKFIINEYDKIP